MKNYIIAVLAIVVMIYFNMIVRITTHHRHYQEYLTSGYTDEVECDKCAIEISELIINGK
jgi:hypothetical protein